jgi:mannosyl-3-phosphoglycerate phosphatase
LAERLIVVTDIDSSLLAPGTRSLPDERAALDFLAARGIPLVINSSRTRAEVERLRQTLQMLAPYICEHGSALVVPHGCFPSVPAHSAAAVSGHVIAFGRPYHEVVDTLRLASRAARVEIVGFAELTIEDVARELGVQTVEAQLAKLREYTELIRIVDENETSRSRLLSALRRRRLRSWRSGRLHLVTATRDRAESLLTLKALWRQAWDEPVIIGLGDSEDDVGWLRHADIAIIVQNDRADVTSRALSKLPTVHVTRWPGRRGWSEAIFEFVGALQNPHQQTKARSLLVGHANRHSGDQPP